MHELGVVFHIADTLARIAEENQVTRIRRVTLELGEVSTVVPEYLIDVWNWNCKRTPLLTGCELVCMLVGERPGLVTDKSMSAYITYRPRTGVSESARTVVSNIHAQGTPAVEAGAHIAGLIETILKKKVSGVGLHLEAGA